MTDSQRILDLRRRVQADPASIAFAQLAEECRRIGNNDEAVGICRNGLAKHPGYLSARVTLARALIELGELDGAKRELDIVVHSAPDNMAAIRGLAEIAQQQGRLEDALAYYRQALKLASHDADLESAVDRISQAIAPPPPVKPPDAAPIAVDELFDFDKLLADLGEPVAEDPTAGEQRAHTQAGVELPAFLRSADAVEGKANDTDELAVVERELRAFETQRAKDEHAAREAYALDQQRLREQEEQLREIESQRLREVEELRQREFEAHQQREAEERLVKELEEQRLMALERERLREAEAQRLRELEAQRARALEAQRLRELEEQRLRALDEERRLQAIEDERRREVEAQRLRELEEQRLREHEEQRLRELRFRELEAQQILALEEDRQRERDAERLRSEEAARLLLEQEAQRDRDAADARRLLARRRHEAVLAGLEGWLHAIETDRDHHSSL